MTDTPEAAVNAEVDRRVQGVADAAAAQIDQANKDAEAIARAAVQTDHVARINELEGKFSSWQSETMQRLETTKAETLALIEASQASILSRLPPPPPPIVTVPPPSDISPTVNPDNEGDEPKNKSQPTKPPELKDQDQSSPRKRTLL
jgi:hypothetical protein